MSVSTLRLAFAGTPDLATTLLQGLLDQSMHQVELVYCQPDRPSGRGRKITKCPVKQLAESRHLSIRQPVKANGIDPDNELAGVDLMVVAAYGMILPGEILTRPKSGCINVHTSLLPRWRGAAPIQRAIQAGDKETGITIMQMDTGLDTGDILLQRRCPIETDDTAGILHDRLAQLGVDCLLEALDKLAAGKLERTKQDDTQANYASKITKAEALIDWTRPAQELERQIRAFNPVPVTHTELNGMPMRIWEASLVSDREISSRPGTIIDCDQQGIIVATGEKLLRINKLQIPGKKPVSVADFLNGHPDFMGHNH